MNGPMPETPTDKLLRELLSYQLYMRRKEPLEGVDAKRRFREGSWKEEGLDIDVLERKGHLPKGWRVPLVLFEVERLRVRSGLFGLRSEHRIVRRLRPLSETIARMCQGKTSAKGGPSEDLDAVIGSELLFPLLMQSGSDDRSAPFRKLVLGSTPQTPPGDISGAAASSRFIGGPETSASDDEAMEAAFRPLRGTALPTIGGRADHKDLASVLFSLFELDDEALSRTLGSGELPSLCREALRSPYLEALMEDLSTGLDGKQETPGRYRERLGRALMEGGVGERFHQRFVQPSLMRLSTCSSVEAQRLGTALGPLMDSRSTPLLLDLLFKVPQDNRPWVMKLIGATGDKSAMEPLRRMLEYSNVERDRTFAKEALNEIGSEPSRKGRSPQI